MLRKAGIWTFAALGLVGIGGFMWLLTRTMDGSSYNTWGTLVVLPVVMFLNAVLVVLVNAREPDRWMRGLLWVGLLAKFVGVVARYLVAFVLYGGSADAQRYNLYAAAHYRGWRNGEILWVDEGKLGTQMLEVITTAVYTVTGPSTIVGFMVFGSLAFWGAYLLVKAFRIALPEGQHRRYAALVLLLPSMLYWPSSIGKESWLLLFGAVTALGAAEAVRGRLGRGWGLIVLGLAGTALVRPHVAALLVAALLVAQLTRKTADTPEAALGKLGGVLLLAVAVWLTVSQSAQFLGIDDLTLQAVSDEILWASGQTAQGGSSFTPVPLESPLGVPAAMLTLLFRPFPWEAGNIQMLGQSIEGLVLLGMTLAALPQLKTLPGLLARNPYLVFALAYAVAFILAFAGFANFGILARQRVLMLPFFLVLLALPEGVPSGWEGNRSQGAAGRHEEHVVSRTAVSSTG